MVSGSAACQTVHPSVRPSVRQSASLSVSLSECLFNCLSVRLSVRLSDRLPGVRCLLMSASQSFVVSSALPVIPLLCSEWPQSEVSGAM